jgi:hypothetical protein
MRGMMKILRVSRTVYHLFNLCVVFICVSVVKLHITKEHPNYWGFEK